MNGLQTILSQPATIRLGWTLLHFLWQGAAIAALLGIALLVLHRARANTRYIVACVALLLMVGVPVLTYGRLTSPAVTALPALAELPELPDVAPSETMAVSGPVPDVPFTPVSVEPIPSTPPPAPQPWYSRTMDWIEANLRWFVGAWFCGVILLSIRLFLGWIGVRRMRLSGTAASATLRERLNPLARRLRVTRPVRLLESAAAEAPVVIGWFRPVILFPASLFTQLSAAQLDAVLAHELAHVRRHDYLVNLFQAIVETLLFYHPAVHWVSRRIRVEREHCCDDLAVSACGDSASYARALATLAEIGTDVPLLAPAANGHLFTRIRRLLSANADHEGGGSMWIGGAVLLTALLVCAVALGASKTGGEKTEDTTVDDRKMETPPDYSAMFEIIGVDDGMRLPTPEEIVKLGPLWPSMPPEENAAYWFAKANKGLIESCKQFPEPPGSLSTEAPYAGDAAGFDQYIQNNAGVLTTVKNGMLPGRTFSLPHLIMVQAGTPLAPLTQLAHIRNLGRFVTDAAFAAELKGVPGAAAEQYLLCIKMGKLIQQDSILITHLVGIAVQSSGAKQLDALLANSSLDQGTLGRIIAYAFNAETSIQERLGVLHSEAKFARAMMAMSLQHALAFGPGYDAYVALMEKEFSKSLPELLRSAEKTAKDIKATYPLHAQAALALLALPQKWARNDLRMRVLQVRAAIALYEKEHGALPKTLSALVPDFLPKVPEDPFSGKPLRYARTPGMIFWNLEMRHAQTQPGWKLWSVGNNLKDDGGQAADVDREGWTGPDFVFTNKVRSNIERRSRGTITTLPTPHASPRASASILEFRLVDESVEKRGEALKDGKSGETLYVLPKILLSEADIASASLEKEPREVGHALHLTLTLDGCRRIAEITERNIGRRLAVVYEGSVLTAPIIMTKINGPAVNIQGSDEKLFEKLAELINTRKPGAASKRDIKFASETKTETGGICRWEVAPGVPVRLLTASYTLENGKMREHTGPGGRQVADQSYRMGVEWEWSVDGDMLAVSRNVTRFEHDGTMMSRVTTKTAIPPNATFKTTSLAEPGILSDEPTILWRGDWMRDGKVVKSVAFVAFAVGEGVQPNLVVEIESGETT